MTSDHISLAASSAQRIEFKVAMLVNRALSGRAPSYLAGDYCLVTDGRPPKRTALSRDSYASRQSDVDQTSATEPSMQLDLESGTICRRTSGLWHSVWNSRWRHFRLVSATKGQRQILFNFTLEILLLNCLPSYLLLLLFLVYPTVSYSAAVGFYKKKKITFLWKYCLSARYCVLQCKTKNVRLKFFDVCFASLLCWRQSKLVLWTSFCIACNCVCYYNYYYYYYYYYNYHHHHHHHHHFVLCVISGAGTNLKEGGHTSKSFCCCAPNTFFGSTSTISFGERFRDGHWSVQFGQFFVCCCSTYGAPPLPSHL